MNAPRIWVDGRPDQAVSALDRALHFGDGVFETLRCEQGRPLWLNYHLQRLKSGCQRLGIDWQHEFAARNELLEAAALTPRSLLKLIVTRGDALARGYAPQGGECCRRILFHYAQEAGPQPTAPLRIALSTVPLAENARLAGIKHLNRLEQVLAQQEMRAQGWDEVLMSTYAGQLISGTMSNVWLWLHDRLVTPALDSAGVAGVTRRVLLEMAGKAGTSVVVRAVARSELLDASAIYLSNVRLGLVQVAELDGRRLAPQPLLEDLRRGLNAEVS